MSVVEGKRGQRPWKGVWLMVVAGIHTVFGLVFFYSTLQQMAAQGFYNTVGEDPLRGAVVWFLLFGFMLFAFALAVLGLERQTATGCWPALGIGLLLIIVLGIVLMPVSGFWLAFPPAFGLLIPSRRMR